MRQHKLHLEDIQVESFSTDALNDPIGTVKGRDADTETCEEECGTLFTHICQSCYDTDCPPHTCISCDWQFTCYEAWTCPQPACGGENMTTLC